VSTIDRFGVTLCLCVKTTIHLKMCSFSCISNSFSSYEKFVGGFVLKQRHKVTWKWHIFDVLLLPIVVGVMKLYRKKTNKQTNKRCRLILLLTSELNSCEATQRSEILIQNSENHNWEFYIYEKRAVNTKKNSHLTKIFLS